MTNILRKFVPKLTVIQSALLVGGSLFTLSFPGHAGPYSPDNVKKGDLITGIYSITTSQKEEIPVVRVQSDGKTYTNVQAGQKIQYNGNSRGVCRSKRKIHKFTWWVNDNSATGPMSYYDKHKKLAEKKWISSKSKKDKVEVAGSMSLNVPSRVASDAVKACKDYLKSQLNKGKSLQDVLSKNHTIKSDQHKDTRLAAVTYMQCSKKQGMNTMLAHAWQNIRINYICEGSEVKEEAKPKPKRAKPFNLTKMAFGALKKNYTGTCPADFKFVGYVKTNGEKGKFRYRFRDHKGKKTSWVTKQMQKGKSHHGIDHVIKLKPARAKAGGAPNQIQGKQDGGMQPKQQLGMKENPWVKMEVENLTNNKKYDRKATYSYECKNMKITKAKVQEKPKRASGRKPDLVVLGNTFQLGNKKATGGASLKLNIGSGQATKKENGMCVFRMKYSIKNNGQATATPAFKSRASVGSKTLHAGTTPKLEAGKKKVISGNIKLGTGEHLVLIKTDNTKKVAESNEMNNAARVKVTVNGNCGNGNGNAGPGPDTGKPSRPAR